MKKEKSISKSHCTYFERKLQMKKRRRRKNFMRRMRRLVQELLPMPCFASKDP